MGLLDILNGMQNGPRGPATPGKGGMSPVTMAILALLAYKAYGKFTSAQPAPSPAPAPGPTPGGVNPALPNLGGLGSLLPGGLGGLLGGLLGGATAGTVVNGGLSDLLKRFQDTGQGDIAKSWISTGPNRDISESDLAKSIGIDNINALAEQTGLPRDQLLADLRRELPDAINKVTPGGRIPDPDELSRHLDQLGSGAAGGER